jgi:acyl-CoA synthetase (NDP forming)
MFYRALLGSGYDKSRMYLINPRVERILDLPVYANLTDIDGPVDHVISSVPARVVPNLVDQCIEKGVRSLHLFTAGFSETGDPEMAKVEQETVARLRSAGIRTIGPNCLGLYVPASGLTFSENFPKEPGDVFLISQSGANASEIVSSLGSRGVRFSKVVSFGNGADLKAHHFFEYAAADPDTKVVLAYLEGVPDGRSLFEAVKSCAAVKPTIILKGGISAAGARAASSHTASLAGSREVFEALCRQVGAIRVESIDDLQDMTMAVTTFAKHLKGGRVALVGGPGGFAVLSSDAIATEGLELPETPADAKDRLREVVPVAGTSINNPIDHSPSGLDDLDRIVRIMAASASYDVVLSTFLANELGGFGRRSSDGERSPDQKAAEELAEAKRGAALLGRIQSEFSVPGVYLQRREDLPAASAAFAESVAIYPSVTRAARAWRRLLEGRQQRSGLPEIF